MCLLRDKNLAIVSFVERSSSLQATGVVEVKAQFSARIPDSLSDGVGVSCARPMQIAASQASSVCYPTWIKA